MVSYIYGSTSRMLIFLYIYARGNGYARQVASFWKCGLTPIQKQMKSLEKKGILVRNKQENTEVYRFVPDYFFLPELQAMIKKTLDSYEPEIRKKLLSK